MGWLWAFLCAVIPEVPIKRWCAAKLHRIAVTETAVDYVGSVAIDEDFMNAAGIEIGEQVQVVNVSNGERWWTYAIAAPRGSHTMSLNGGGAYKGSVGDRLVVMTYVNSRVRVVCRAVFFNDKNEIVEIGTSERHGATAPDIKEAM